MKSANAYQLALHEREAVALYIARTKKKRAVPRIKVVQCEGSINRLELDHPDRLVAACLLSEAIGTGDQDFIGGLLGQLANVGSLGQKVDESELNFMLSLVKGVEPRDQLEAMLAAQMAATHVQVMTFARRLAHVENIPQQDSAERAYNKLARTFAAQVEALKRYRSGGEQTVRVEHVTVNEGGQAIVGNVTARGRGTPQKTEPTP